MTSTLSEDKSTAISTRAARVAFGAPSSTLDRGPALVWLLELCGLLASFRIPIRTGCLWPRRKHRLASAVRIFHLHALKGQLAPYKINKGTIRFPLFEPVPVGLIGHIAKLRAKEVAQRKKPKLAVTNR